MRVNEGQISPFLPKRDLKFKFGSEEVNSGWCSAVVQTSGLHRMVPTHLKLY